MMNSEADLTWIEQVLYHRTGQYLSDLQRVILSFGLKGKRYLDIAEAYGCTEGHAKDVGAQLWQSLSGILGEKVTKQNLCSALNRCLGRANHQQRRVQSRAPAPSQRFDPAAHRLFHWSWEEHRPLNPCFTASSNFGLR